MKKIRLILPLFLIALSLSSKQIPAPDPVVITAVSPTLLNTPTTKVEFSLSPPQTSSDPPSAASIHPISSPTLDPIPYLFGCALNMEFASGPIEGKSSEFTVLDRDYFFDKGEKFFPGKNTAIYYEDVHYLILHSAFHNGNILQPLKAEFIRHYLESWGDPSPEFVQRNIDELMGSEVNWFCDGKLLISTRVQGIVRLSHVASNQLWLEPWNLYTILENKEGLVSEWIGEIKLSDDPRIFLGFCGWGPRDSGDERFVDYRYLIDLIIQD